jgi:hypothetical protein
LKHFRADAAILKLLQVDVMLGSGLPKPIHIRHEDIATPLKLPSDRATQQDL